MKVDEFVARARDLTSDTAGQYGRIAILRRELMEALSIIERQREALEQIKALDYTEAATNCSACVAHEIARKALEEV